MSKEETKKVKRSGKPRRTFENQLKDIASYCRMAADIHKQFAQRATTSQADSVAFTEKAEAYRDVLARIEGEV